jgi:hypothetical protein
MTNKYWQKMRHRRWPRTAHPACRASSCALTGQRASIAGNGSGRRLVCCSSPRYGVHTSADPRLSGRSHSRRPRRPVAPVLLLPCRNLGSQAQSQVHRPVNPNGADPARRAARDLITPSEQPASSTSQVRLFPLAAPPAVTHPLIFHAKYQNRRWFPTGSAANPCHAGWRPVSLHRQRRLLLRAPNEQRGIGKQSVRHQPSGDDVFRPEVAERQRDQDQRVGDRHRGALDHPAP